MVVLIGVVLTCLVACSKEEKEENINNGNVVQNEVSKVLTLREVNEDEFITTKKNDAYKYDVYENHIEIVEYLGGGNKIEIPSKIDGLTVSKIVGLFNESKEYEVNEIVIPNTVISLKEESYDIRIFVPTVNKIEIPEKLEEMEASSVFSTKWYENLNDEFSVIGDGILIKCNIKDENLTSLAYPEGVKKIYATLWASIGLKARNFGDEGSSASKIKELIIPEGCEEINVTSNMMLSDADSLEKIVIPSSVKKIAMDTFKGSKWLDSFQDKFVVVGDGVLIDINLTESVDICEIPDGVKYIGCTLAYGDCYWSKLVLPESLKGAEHRSIKDFYEIEVNSKNTSLNTQALENWDIRNGILTIPYGYEKLDRNAIGIFAEEKLFCEVTVSEGIKEIGKKAFDGYYNLTKISIPSSCTAIRDDAFYGCLELTNVELGDGLTYIGDRAFFSCSEIKSITIPESVTYIGDGAFDKPVWGDSFSLDYETACYLTEIKGVQGSYAETYAKEKGIKFTEIG